MEHWARQQIVQAIIQAEVKCLNSKGKALAVSAGEAADHILDVLFGPPKYTLDQVMGAEILSRHTRPDND